MSGDLGKAGCPAYSWGVRLRFTAGGSLSACPLERWLGEKKTPPDSRQWCVRWGEMGERWASLSQRDGQRRDLVVVRPSLQAREDGEVDRALEPLAVKDDAGARPAQRLVRGRRDHVAVLERVGGFLRRDEARDVRLWTCRGRVADVSRTCRGRASQPETCAMSFISSAPTESAIRLIRA